MITTDNSKKDKNIKTETWISSTIGVMQGLSINSMWLSQKNFWNKKTYTSIPTMMELLEDHWDYDYKY